MLRQPPLQVRRETDVKPIVLRRMQQVDVEHPLFVPRQRRGAKPFTRQHVHIEHRVRVSRRDRVRRSLLRGNTYT